MRKKKLVTLIGSVCLILVLAVMSFMAACPAPAPPPEDGEEAPPPEKTWELKFAAFLPASSRSHSEVYEPYIKQIEEATNGRVKITTYPGGILAKESELWEALESGLVDIGYMAHGAVYAGRCPLTCLTTLPMLSAPNVEIMGKILTELYYEFPEIQKEYEGIKVLSFYSTPPYIINTVKKPVYKLEDLEGLTIRSLGAPSSFFEAAGATPVYLPSHDMYLALERGTIDAACFSPVGIESNNLQGLLKYHTLVYISSIPFGFFMNQELWDSFPPDIQQAIWDKIGGYAGAEYIGRGVDSQIQGDLDLFESLGNEIISLSPEELERWEDLARPVWDEEIAKVEAQGLPGRAVVNRYIELLEKYK